MPSVNDHFKSAFFEFDFFQAIRVLERANPTRKPVGLDENPSEEVVRFRPHLSLAFPPSQIVGIEPPDEFRAVPMLTVTFFGLYGASGVLPTHYTQLMLDLIRDVRGPERRSLRDFIDIFNHRLISLFYRSWEKYRFYIAYDRGDAFRAEPDTFTMALQSLVGVGSAGHQNRLCVRPLGSGAGVDASGWTRTAAKPLAQTDDLALLHYAGFFAQRPRNATNLRLLLSDYFGLPISVELFRGQWLAIDPDRQTQLGTLGTLGTDAIAGERVWDITSRFRLSVGPLNYQQFEEFLPDPDPVPVRKSFFLLAQLARLFAGPELDFDVQLVLAPPSVPEVELIEGLGAGPRLGWNLWLISDIPEQPAEDACFEGDWVTAL